MASTSIYKLSFFLLTLFVLSGLILISQTVAGAVSVPKTLDRDLEPVVIKGSNVGRFAGVPVQQLFVYTYTGSSWGEQIPVQIDEVTAAGSYTLIEDNVLDANDEIVFMALDLGARAPSTAPLTMTLPISDTWYEIEVSDPTAPTKKGWAYLVRSTVLAPTFSDDYVDYHNSNQRVMANHYELGMATTGADPFFGVDYLALNGSGVDILDRTKLRVNATFFVPVTVTEEGLTNPQTTLLKDGPVRVLLRQTGNASIAGLQEAIFKAYASLLQGVIHINFNSSGITISSARTSVDFSSLISPATLHNANTAPSGILINGNPDSVPALPLSHWSQINHSTGRLIFVGDPTPAGGTQRKNFYKDDSSLDNTDTGDQKSYGDFGFLIEGNVNKKFSIQNFFFILPPASNLNDVGAVYSGYFFNPLNTVTRPIPTPPVFLPIVIK